MKRLLYIAFFLEAGFVLLAVPWSAYWDRNYFLQDASFIQSVLTSNFARGAVSGLGLVNVAAGLAELARPLLRRTAGGEAPISPLGDDR